MENPPKLAPDCPFQKRFPSQLNRDDRFYMQLAYNQALDAWKANEVPIGAVIKWRSEVIGAAYNRVETAKDPTAHAEMLAITQASQGIKDWRLNEATLYVTKEPCPMCSGAAMMARLKRVVYAIPDPKMGGLGGLYDVNSYSSINHRLVVEQGVFKEECLELLQAFFQLKRAMNKSSRPSGS